MNSWSWERHRYHIHPGGNCSDCWTILGIGEEQKGSEMRATSFFFCPAAPPQGHLPFFLKQCGFTHSTQLTSMDGWRMRVSQCFPDLLEDPLWAFVKSASTDSS